MPLFPVYDEQQIRRLARDISELLILPAYDSAGYERMARKLYATGWRNVSEEV